MKNRHPFLNVLFQMLLLAIWLPVTFCHFMLYKAEKWYQDRNKIDPGKLKWLEHRRKL